jgi:Domain of unknown function (DUF1983)
VFNGFNSIIGALPPTIGVKDPETRQVLDALISHLDLRGGNSKETTDDRYVTVRDLKAAGEGRSSVLERMGSGGSSGGVNQEAVRAVQGLQNNIRESLIYQLLETPIQLVDLAPIRTRIDSVLQIAETGISAVNTALTTATESLTSQINAAVSRLGDAEAAIIKEEETRATETSALTKSLEAAVSRIGTSESAIVTETQTRSSKDNSLAEAINTIWAAVGNGEAVIQDSVLAAVTPAAIEASKFSQLQIALKDPDDETKYISSAAIRQDASAALTATGKLEARYTVKIDLNGYITGFGLASTENNGTPTSDFQVRADRFSIVSPTGDNSSALILTNNTLKVYDEQGRLRVRIGNLSK